MTESKLTDDQVRTIRKLTRDPNRKYNTKAIARRFGVSDTIIRHIKNGKIYTEVKDD
jgi:DNA-binding GntR family transcriptional regulator